MPIPFTFPEPTSPEPPPPPIYAIATDENGVVNRTHLSNILPEGFIEVSPEVFYQAMGRLGEVFWVDGTLIPPPDRTLHIQ